MYVYRDELEQFSEMSEKQFPAKPGVAAQFAPSFSQTTLFRGARFSFFLLSTSFSWPEIGVDVSSVPVKELVAIFGGDVPSVQRWLHPQLTE